MQQLYLSCSIQKPEARSEGCAPTHTGREVGEKGGSGRGAHAVSGSLTGTNYEADKHEEMEMGGADTSCIEVRKDLTRVYLQVIIV